MITALDEYKELLYRIQDPNKTNKIIQLPSDEKIYHIDLNNRSIETPDVITLEYEHNAETIFFSVDRYFDNVDLASMYCVIQYRNESNPNKKSNGYIYPVPFFDLDRLKDENRMVFQWAIQGPATAYAGKVTFSIKFYRISRQQSEDANGMVTYNLVYDYILNTLPNKLTIESSLNITAESEQFIIPAPQADWLQQQIDELRRTNDIYWIIMDDSFDENEPVVFEYDYPDDALDRADEIYSVIQGW